ncbi:MAG: hypothetical protein A2289_24885 [Deltaproteobacteria bacterium RIFOXYA12_FULL_58_15]|nr:MAG: hypothetical protein A2289_24885 [Deltaproteobacteria bacterium RIFOXYA12_FULL_58_15]
MVELLVWVIAAEGFLTPTAHELGIEPNTVIAGELETVVLRAIGISEARFEVEAGTVGPLTHHENGITAVWHLPTQLPPRRLACAAIDETTGSVVFAVLAVKRRARFDIASRAGAQVELTLDGTVVAAGRTANDGQMVMNVVVPPGRSRATVAHRLAGKLLQTEEIHLGTENSLRLWGVSTNRGSRWFAYRDDGSPIDGATFTATNSTNPVRARSLASNVWHVQSPKDQEDTIVEGRIAKGADLTSFHLVMSRRPTPDAGLGGQWTVAAKPGLITDFDGWISPTLAVTSMLHPPSLADFVFVFDVSTSVVQIDGKLSEEHWLLPVTVGAARIFEPASPWRIEAGLGTGAMLSFVDATRTKSNGKNKDLSSTAGDWIMSAWGLLSYPMGPGELIGEARFCLTITEPESWKKRIFSLSPLLGYRVTL